MDSLPRLGTTPITEPGAPQQSSHRAITESGAQERSQSLAHKSNHRVWRTRAITEPGAQEQSQGLARRSRAEELTQNCGARPCAGYYGEHAIATRIKRDCDDDRCIRTTQSTLSHSTHDISRYQLLLSAPCLSIRVRSPVQT